MAILDVLVPQERNQIYFYELKGELPHGLLHVFVQIALGCNALFDCFYCNILLEINRVDIDAIDLLLHFSVLSYN
jgi:hypothetical protein